MEKPAIFNQSACWSFVIASILPEPITFLARHDFKPALVYKPLGFLFFKSLLFPPSGDQFGPVFVVYGFMLIIAWAVLFFIIYTIKWNNEENRQAPK
jgi:hypothetical protein